MMVKASATATKARRRITAIRKREGATRRDPFQASGPVVPRPLPPPQSGIVFTFMGPVRLGRRGDQKSARKSLAAGNLTHVNSLADLNPRGLFHADPF